MHSDSRLSARELEILLLAAHGMSDADMSRRLSISPRTVASHMRSIREKLRAKNRTHLIVTALRAGILALRTDRSERDDVGQRDDWSDRADPSDRWDRWARTDGLDGADRLDRTNRMGQGGRMDRGDRPDRAGRPGRPDRLDETFRLTGRNGVRARPVGIA
ncbi:helix-turn-helix transcriptional regulator [Streptomyces europaeiscabiei]|uniref:response regulator transcription factor n=1 Tax=Streptomyces europaeiscabiei TaxID=146819 RepID=UPI002E0F77B7|nr:helix-turn-helix transcriptional regulator [Streptomyces europaeiscabiei]